MRTIILETEGDDRDYRGRSYPVLGDGPTRIFHNPWPASWVHSQPSPPNEYVRRRDDAFRPDLDAEYDFLLHYILTPEPEPPVDLDGETRPPDPSGDSGGGGERLFP